MEFDAWLTERLLELKTDEMVFGPYIKSIVEGDEDLEDKVEALDGIIEGLGDASLDVEKFRDEILSRWEAFLEAKKAGGDGGRAAGQLDPSGSKTLGAQLERLLLEGPGESTEKGLLGLKELHESPVGGSEGQTGLRLKGPKDKKEMADCPDSALRAAILKQCREDFDSDEDEGGDDGAYGGGGLFKNTNVERVLSEQKEYKEQAKADAAKKRERDKEDRTRQKKAAEERKEKAKKKATKVEKRMR